MPTYEYACTRCGQHIEVYQRMADASLTTCGACGGALRKVFHPAGIMFKGPGFYSTDSRSKSKTSREPASSGEGSKDQGSKGEGPKGEGKTESKTEGPSKHASENKPAPAKEKTG